MGGTGGAEGWREARAARWAVLGLALLALLPSLGTLAAPWIAEDSSLLAAATENGPWRDWGRSQGGMLLLRFWRPVVSTSWAFQAATTGVAPLPLRLFNLALHVLVTLLVWSTARGLGARRDAAFLAGAWVAFFPEQGGTSTWLAGRTDLLGGAFLVGSLWASLRGRPGLALGSAFLACASKEFGFLAPIWVVLFAWARGERGPALARRAAPAALAASVAFVWRWWALDGLSGGYAATLPGLGSGLVGAGRAVLAAEPFSVVPVLGLGLWSWLQANQVDRDSPEVRRAQRTVLAGLVAALLGYALLYPLLADGYLEPENRRLFYVPECALALTLACALPALPRKVLLLLAALIGARGMNAWSNAQAWALAAREGEAEVARVRAVIADDPASELPVVGTRFAVSRHDAYCLGFGLAARFREPFPPSPRPVWPWRLFAIQDARRERSPVLLERAPGLFDAELGREDGLLPLPVFDGDGFTLERLALDERCLPSGDDRSARLRVRSPAGTALEALVVCALGYEPFPLGPLVSGESDLSLRELLARSNGVLTAGEFLMQAADLGERRACLELRALDEASRPQAASTWVPLEWEPGLLQRALSAE